MTIIERSSDAVWQGDIRAGHGVINAPSGVMKDVDYTWAGRFETGPGTNPEELIASAHAACLSMAATARLVRGGFKPQSIHTHATLYMEMGEGGATISRALLEVEGVVPGMDQNTFKHEIEEAEKGCPVSRLLRPGLKEIVVVATLKS